MITTDRNLPNQQNLSGRRIAVLVLPTTSWPLLQQIAARIADDLHAIKPGEYKLVAL